MKINLFKMEMFFRKNWLTIILAIVIVIMAASCGPTKKHKSSELKETEQKEFVVSNEITHTDTGSEIQKKNTSEEIKEEKRETETDSDRTITADEVFVDKDGNISAKGNVIVTEKSKEKLSETTKTNKTKTEAETSKEFESLTTHKSETSESSKSSKEEKRELNKESEGLIVFKYWWLFLLLIAFVVYRKIKSKIPFRN